MARKQKIAKRPKPKTVLRLPDLEQSKNAVLNSLADSAENLTSGSSNALAAKGSSSASGMLPCRGTSTP
jgi:hypothetical protein